MNTNHGVTAIVLGLVVVLLAYLYRSRSQKRIFRILFLVGHMGLAGGLIASRFAPFWMGFGIFLLWFAVAIVFLFQERAERIKGRE